MTKAKSTPIPRQSQAQRFLDAARKAQVDEGGRSFARTMGKITLAKDARKPRKMG